MLTPDQLHTLDIERPAAGGRMIARAEGQVVLVDGAIPGERAVVRVDRIGKGVAYGHVTAIETASPDRRDPFTDRTCGGCLYAHIAYPRQLEIKSLVIADALSRIGKIQWPSAINVAASAVEGYRMRARLHLRHGRIGFFREGTHDLCDARGTRQLLPETSDVLDRLAAGLSDVVDDAEVEVSETVNGSGRAIHVESLAGHHTRFQSALAGLEGLDGWTGLTVTSAGGGQDATIFATGEPYVSDALSIEGCEFSLRRHVLSFFQANRYLLRDLVTMVLRHIPPDQDVLDLYAGAGLFAVSAAVARNARVTAVEGDRYSALDLEVNAAQTGGAVEAVHQAVEEFFGRSRRRPGVLIVDPPRTGMSKASLGAAVGLKAPRVVYVSCDVATLARDLARFLAAGYHIVGIDAFDLFPNTPHVEMVVGLERR